jgi:hypothetical protein
LVITAVVVGVGDIRGPDGGRDDVLDTLAGGCPGVGYTNGILNNERRVMNEGREVGM